MTNIENWLGLRTRYFASSCLLSGSLCLVKLVLVGDGELRPQIENMVAKLGLQNYVEITGWASNEEVKQQILDSRAMVLPSFAEGLPVAIMETLALGRPVISTYVAGIPEFVKHGEHGFLTLPCSFKNLVSAIREVLQLPVAKLEQMGKVGAERVGQRHDVAVEAGKLAALFQSDLESLPEKTTINVSTKSSHYVEV